MVSIIKLYFVLFCVFLLNGSQLQAWQTTECYKTQKYITENINHIFKTFEFTKEGFVVDGFTIRENGTVYGSAKKFNKSRYLDHLIYQTLSMFIVPKLNKSRCDLKGYASKNILAIKNNDKYKEYKKGIYGIVYLYSPVKKFVLDKFVSSRDKSKRIDLHDLKKVFSEYMEITKGNATGSAVR